ncbi:hypothetical protein Tco_0014460 [Tanacetum coccineum]
MQTDMFLKESRALICTLLKESSEKDRELHLSMYGKAAQLQKQLDAKSAWFQEKYFGRTHGGIGCSSSQTDFPLTEKELHQSERERMKKGSKRNVGRSAMNKKAQEEKIARTKLRMMQSSFCEFGVECNAPEISYSAATHFGGVIVGCYLASVPQEEDHQYLIVILGLIVPLVIVAIGVEVFWKR